jgi:hypothetical protein
MVLAFAFDGDVEIVRSDMKYPCCTIILLGIYGPCVCARWIRGNVPGESGAKYSFCERILFGIMASIVNVPRIMIFLFGISGPGLCDRLSPDNGPGESGVKYPYCAIMLLGIYDPEHPLWILCSFRLHTMEACQRTWGDRRLNIPFVRESSLGFLVLAFAIDGAVTLALGGSGVKMCLFGIYDRDGAAVPAALKNLMVKLWWGRSRCCNIAIGYQTAHGPFHFKTLLLKSYEEFLASCKRQEIGLV